MNQEKVEAFVTVANSDNGYLTVVFGEGTRFEFFLLPSRVHACPPVH